MPEFQDTPTHRISVTDMTDEQLEAFVTALQERRMAARRDFEAAQALRNRKMLDDTREKLEHTIKMMRKDLDSIDKKLTKVTERAAVIRALRRTIEAHQIELELEKETIHEVVSRP